MCVSCFTTGGPGKEHGTDKPPPTRRVRERSKGDTACPSTSQNPSLWHPSWLNDAYVTRKDPESEWLAKDNPETNPITIKHETASHMAQQSSWIPLPSCSPPGHPFPIKSLALSAHVSPMAIHFRVLDKSPALGPGSGPPSCNIYPGWNLTRYWHGAGPRRAPGSKGFSVSPISWLWEIGFIQPPWSFQSSNEQVRTAVN